MARLRNGVPGGIGQYFEGYLEDGKLIREVYESTCAHCAKGTEIKSLREANDDRVVGFCRGCMRFICLRCVGKPCITQEQETERIEAAVRKQAIMDSWGCY